MLLLQVREYVEQLEAHLTEAHRQATRLIKRQSELGQSLAEFGTSMVALGKFEQDGLASSFQVLGGKAEQLARYSQVVETTTNMWTVETVLQYLSLCVDHQTMVWYRSTQQG